MIKTSLRECPLESVLPPGIEKETEMIALCRVVDLWIGRVLDMCEGLNIWSDLSKAREDVLDYLAVELRTQFYEKTLPIEVKRKLIANTLVWHEKAGTDLPIAESVSYVFGRGEVENWYEYGGKSPCFRVVVDNESVKKQDTERFLELIQSFKRKTAKLDYMIIPRSVKTTEYYGNAVKDTITSVYHIGEEGNG